MLCLLGLDRFCHQAVSSCPFLFVRALTACLETPVTTYGLRPRSIMSPKISGLITTSQGSRIAISAISAGLPQPHQLPSPYKSPAHQKKLSCHRGTKTKTMTKKTEYLRSANVRVQRHKIQDFSYLPTQTTTVATKIDAFPFQGPDRARGHSDEVIAPQKAAQGRQEELDGPRHVYQDEVEGPAAQEFESPATCYHQDDGDPLPGLPSESNLLPHQAHKKMSKTMKDWKTCNLLKGHKN